MSPSTLEEYQEGGDFIHIEGDRYAPAKFVNRKGELKKGVKWVDNPNLDKEWFDNTEGERVYAYNATELGMNPDDPNAWLQYYEKNEGPMQYQRKLGWTLGDLFEKKNVAKFEQGGLNEGDEVYMTEAELKQFIQMGGEVEILDDRMNTPRY